MNSEVERRIKLAVWMRKEKTKSAKKQNLRLVTEKQVLRPPIDKYFYCMICYEVVEDACKCGKCSKLYCNSCLDVHKRKSSNCPYCQ